MSEAQLALNHENADRLRRAVLPADTLAILRNDFGIKQATIAAATGTTDRTIRSWESGKPMHPKHAEQLGWLADVVIVISQAVIGHGIDQWLNARLRLLDGERSIEMIANDRGPDAVAAARSFVEGAYV